MTPEEELELLIAEQQRDDTHIIWPDRNATTLSLDAPSPEGDGTMSDLIGVDEHGEIIHFLPRSRGFAMGRLIPHGTPGGYTNHRCRCRACTTAQSAHHLDWYAKNRKRPVETRTCACDDCENEFDSNQPHAAYCSVRCRDRAWYERVGKQRRLERRLVTA